MYRCISLFLALVLFCPPCFCDWVEGSSCHAKKTPSCCTQQENQKQGGESDCPHCKEILKIVVKNENVLAFKSSLLFPLLAVFTILVFPNTSFFPRLRGFSSPPLFLRGSLNTLFCVFRI